MAGAPALIALSVLFQAAAEAFLAGRISSGDSLRFSLLAFFGCALLFLVVSRIRRTPARRAARPWAEAGTLRLFVALNVVSAVTFLGLYLALVWVPAAFAASLMAGVGPTAATVLATWSGRRHPAASWLRSAGLFAASVITAAAVQPSLLDTSTWQSGPAASAVGAGLGVLAGVGAAVIAQLSRQLGAHGITPAAVMPHRFHLPYLLAALALTSDGLTQAPRLSWTVTCRSVSNGLRPPSRWLCSPPSPASRTSCKADSASPSPGPAPSPCSSCSWRRCSPPAPSTASAPAPHPRERTRRGPGDRRTPRIPRACAHSSWAGPGNAELSGPHGTARGAESGAERTGRSRSRAKRVWGPSRARWSVGRRGRPDHLPRRWCPVELRNGPKSTVELRNLMSTTGAVHAYAPSVSTLGALASGHQVSRE